MQLFQTYRSPCGCEIHAASGEFSRVGSVLTLPVLGGLNDLGRWLYAPQCRYVMNSASSTLEIIPSRRAPLWAEPTPCGTMRRGFARTGYCMGATMTHEDYMRLAIESARTVSSVPFAAVIVRRATGECLAIGANRSAENPILHGEIDAIIRCAEVHPDVDWTELAIYSTAEPCCMCQSAIAWAGISTVYYGTSIRYLQRKGWKQIDIRADEVARRTPFREISIVGGILEADCNALFAQAVAGRHHVAPAKE